MGKECRMRRATQGPQLNLLVAGCPRIPRTVGVTLAPTTPRSRSALCTSRMWLRVAAARSLRYRLCWKGAKVRDKGRSKPGDNDQDNKQHIVKAKRLQDAVEKVP